MINNKHNLYSPNNWRGKKNKKINNVFLWFKLNKKGLWSKLAILSGLFLVISSLILFIMFFWISRDLPEPGKLQQRLIAESTKIYDRTGDNLLYEIHGDQKRTLVKINEIPDYTVKAFVALEDKTFFEHKGLSVKHIVKAITLYGFKKIGLYHGLVPGGSTLTQQFVKNSILTNEKKVTRKIKEWILSYQIEKKYSKEEILELYFNEIPFGSTAYGIESATQTYFGKSVRDINLAESAILAAMIQAPTYYSPYGNHVEELFARQKFVLSEMVDMNFISEEQATEAAETDVEFKKSLGNIKAPHFVLYVKELLTEIYGERMVEQGGLKVYTTLDLYKQNIAEEVVNEQAEKNQTSWNASNAALIALDPKTGEILSMVGSKNFFDDNIDGQVNVTLRPRQPGSSFKPIVYTTAWTKGFVPETVVYDVVTKFKTDIGKDYEPKNYDLKEHGPISLRKALQGSLNIPAVKTLYLTGIKNVLDLAEKMGYTTFTDRSRFGLSLVLGGGEVKLIEHTAAFGVLAREGKKADTVAILKITDNDGQVLFNYEPKEPTQVIDQKAARITNSVLSDDSARAFVFGNGGVLTLPNRPVAVKTGTTNDYRDAWTVGYTPSLVTGVWVGNNDFSEMKRGADGSIVAAPIWHNFMSRILQNTPVENFNKPEYELPDKAMLNGSVGAETILKIDSQSGLLATDLTPQHLIVEKTFREIHNILYFVDINNPLGPIPGAQSKDPQYTNWEEAVLSWAEKNNIITNEQPPTEFDNLHSVENKPFIDILEPWPEQVVGNNLNIRVSWETKKPFKKLEVFVDDLLIKTYENLSENTAQFSINLSDFEIGDHFLKVVIYDVYDNSNLSWLKIIKN